jgi:molybdopterin-guanine dinucleotide biosynthesis protein A
LSSREISAQFAGVAEREGRRQAMTDRDSTLGLILDGGLARRMGGADKGLVVLGGKPMLMHVVERLGPQCGALALSANGDPQRFAGLGFAVLADDPPGALGPLAGILAGLEACLARVPRLAHVASLPADTPFAPLDFVGRLHAVRRGGDAEIALAASGGRRHHLAALWPVELAAELSRALRVEGLRKVESFVRRYRLAVAEWPSEPVDPFFNVNAPADLEAAEAVLSRASSVSGRLV